MRILFFIINHLCTKYLQLYTRNKPNF